MKGMFEWLFGVASLSIPCDSRSLEFELVADAPPCAPHNTLEYDVDPIQELFGATKSSVQIKMWNEYHENMKNELDMQASALQLAENATSQYPA